MNKVFLFLFFIYFLFAVDDFNIIEDINKEYINSSIAVSEMLNSVESVSSVYSLSQNAESAEKQISTNDFNKLLEELKKQTLKIQEIFELLQNKKSILTLERAQNFSIEKTKPILSVEKLQLEKEKQIPIVVEVKADEKGREELKEEKPVEIKPVVADFYPNGRPTPEGRFRNGYLGQDNRIYIYKK